jgi:hypothetical protein
MLSLVPRETTYVYKTHGLTKRCETVVMGSYVI